MAKNNVPSQLAQYKWYNFAIYVDIGDIKQEEVDVIACKTDLKLDVSLSHTYA